MHINERGLTMRILLYLTILLVIVVGCGGAVKKEPEVVMEPINQQEQINLKLKEQQTFVPLPPIIEKPQPKYGFTEDEIYLLTVLLCGSSKKDGDGEYDFVYQKRINHQQIYLVLNVVMNRVNSDEYRGKVAEVVWAKGQFSYMPNWRGRLPKVDPKAYEVVRQWCSAYDAGDTSILTIPANHLYFSGDGKINRSRAR